MGSAHPDLFQILRLLGSRISRFVSFLLDPMNAGSIGAVAGFAIAFICAWKYLKTPSDHQKRLEKRESVTRISTESSTTGASTSVSHIPQSTNHSVVTQDPKLSLREIVRKRLNGGRKMTCQLLGVIFEETTPEQLQTHAVVRPAVVDVLLELAQACDLYLMARLVDDESEEVALAALEVVGLFSQGGLNRNKVLFCSTEAGRASFVRQLEPDWHVDTSAETISQLARFVRNELHISPKESLYIAPNVVDSESLEGYFGNVDHV